MRIRAEAAPDVSGTTGSPEGPWSKAGEASVGAAPPPATALDDAAGQIARWLVLVLAIDLLVTRFVVRLAMFIPKEGPAATISQLVGHLAAVTDTLVPVMGLLLLGMLLALAWRRADPGALVAGALTGLVALGGVLLLVVTPTPAFAAVTGAAVVAAAIVAGTALWRARASRTSRLGAVLLAIAVGLTGLRTVLVAWGGAGSGAGPGGSPAIGAAALEEVAFVAGAALLGVAGLSSAIRAHDPRLRRLLVVGAVVTVVVLVAWLRSPSQWDALMIWSIGLSGAVPVPIVAMAAGMAVPGLIALASSAPRMAVGAAIVLLAGSGLAASGLLLAGLLGLIVAATDGDADPGRPGAGSTSARVTGRAAP